MEFGAWRYSFVLGYYNTLGDLNHPVMYRVIQHIRLVADDGVWGVAVCVCARLLQYKRRPESPCHVQGHSAHASDSRCWSLGGGGMSLCSVITIHKAT